MKWLVSIWLIGSLLPSIVSMILWILLRLGCQFVLPGTSLYLELLAALLICIVAICLWRIGWKWKIFAGVATVVLLLGQLVLLGTLAIRDGGLVGTQ